ncbi:MAG: hypothetical protein ACJAXA_000145 [Candidatus Aldehydirespiratoraceae bacterium]
MIASEASAATATWTSSRSPSEQLDETLAAVLAVVARDESHDRQDGEPMST